jgi:uncharacterized membrane protein YdjX (TVP38/TMEM64 family)
MRYRFTGGFALEASIALGLLFVAVLLAGIFLFDAESHVASLLDWVNEQEFWGPVIFTLTYVLVVVLVLPGILFTLGAGFLFGIVKGSLFVIIGETMGATIAFLIARHFFGAGLARFMVSHPRFDLINRSVGREGWKFVLLTRMVPFFPFKLSNYFFGLSRYPLPGFVLGTLFGIIPFTVINVYIGSLAADLATLGSRNVARSNVEWAMYGLGLVIALATAVYLTRIARRALTEGDSDE